MERSHGFHPENNISNDEPYEPIFLQQIEKITHVPHTESVKPPSALEALMRLASAESSDRIGYTGPLLAAGATEHNAHLEEFGHYQEIYPRDAYVSAKLLWFKYPELTKATIRTCLPFTGNVDNLSNTEWRDEQEVGKMPHQIRDPEHQRSKRQYELRQRGYPYYGAVDTTQKNILAISRVSLSDLPDSLSFLNEQYQGLDEKSHSVFEGLNANVDWVTRRMLLNPEGLVESIQINPLHHANQSWVDSPDSFHHADGSLARHHPEKNLGVASVEVNAETYDALLATIRIYEAILPRIESAERSNLEETIETLTAQAAKLKQSILEEFWVDDPEHFGGYFARGTDRDEDGKLYPLKIRSSDMGHLLLSDVLDYDNPKVVSIVKNLFSPGMLAENRIRTLSSDSARYHPEAYHNGSVWPWDTYTIALGLE